MEIKYEIRYQPNDGEEYHLYANGIYALQLEREHIIKILEKFFQDGGEVY